MSDPAMSIAGDDACRIIKKFNHCYPLYQYHLIIIIRIEPTRLHRIEPRTSGRWRCCEGFILLLHHDGSRQQGCKVVSIVRMAMIDRRPSKVLPTV